MSPHRVPQKVVNESLIALLRVLLGTKRGLVFSTLRAETKVVGPKFEYHVKIFLLSFAYRGSAIRSLLSSTFTMILQRYYNHCVVSLKLCLSFIDNSYADYGSHQVLLHWKS